MRIRSDVADFGAKRGFGVRRGAFRHAVTVDVSSHAMNLRHYLMVKRILREWVKKSVQRDFDGKQRIIKSRVRAAKKQK